MNSRLTHLFRTRPRGSLRWRTIRTRRPHSQFVTAPKATEAQLAQFLHKAPGKVELQRQFETRSILGLSQTKSCRLFVRRSTAPETP